MLAKLRKLLAPPVFDDPDRTRAAALLNSILWATLLLAFTNVFGVVHAPREALPTALILAFTVLGIFLAHRGYDRAVSTAYACFMWLTSTIVLAAFGGGIRDPRVITYPVAITMAGLLVGARLASFLTVLTIIVTGLLAVAETRGLLPPFEPPPVITIWVGTSLTIVMLGVLIFFATRGLHQALETAREAQRASEELNRRLREKNAEIERFTYAVTHDLKSPLFTIRGYVGLLENDVRDGAIDRLPADITPIREASEQMARLLEDLLALSKAGEVELSHEEIPFGDLVEKAIQLLAGRLAESGAEVVVAPDLPAVRGDATRLVQVMQNLIDNAAKYMGEQPEPRIEVGARQEDEPVFYVRDNGRGIAPQYHAQVFENFTRLDKDVEGSGIGLAHVRKVVEAHGGRIWVESEGEGRGATFCFVLPDA